MAHSTEYPTLKVGDTIQCSSQKEAQTLGTALKNEGFDYISRGFKITIVEKGQGHEKGFAKDRAGD